MACGHAGTPLRGAHAHPGYGAVGSKLFMRFALTQKQCLHFVRIFLVSGFRFQVSGFRFQAQENRKYMDIVRLLALVGLIGFSAFTGYAMIVSDQPLVEFGMELMSSTDTAQVVIDLYVMAILACCWMFYDNRRRGRGWLRVVPYFAITAVFVSIGPLLYIFINGISSNQNAAP
jgi:hypothetical protein